MARSVTIERGSQTWYADGQGWIEAPGVTGSDQWRIMDAVTLNNFGAAVHYYSLAEILADPESIPWKFKNGKQRTFIRDFDHGGFRQWCSPGYSLRKAPSDG